MCLLFPAWLCAASPTLVMSGTCWWESPRTWFWTHAQLLGGLSTHTSWWIVVRSWSFCTRYGEWWDHFQAECWSSSYLPECCSYIAVLGASWARLSCWCYTLEAAVEKISCLLQNHLVHLLQSWELTQISQESQFYPSNWVNWKGAVFFIPLLGRGGKMALFAFWNMSSESC